MVPGTAEARRGRPPGRCLAGSGAGGRCRQRRRDRRGPGAVAVRGVMLLYPFAARAGAGQILAAAAGGDRAERGCWRP